MKKSILLVILLKFVTVSFGQPFNTYESFIHHLDSITKISDITQRNTAISNLWSWLKTNDQVPFRMEEKVAFLYKGTATSVYFAGDMNGWGNSSENYNAAKQNLSNVWLLEKQYPQDARLDYKIVLNGNNWIMDPDNPHVQMGGFGNNSELRMPAWQQSPYITLGSGVNKGLLSENIIITSTNLGYDVQYKVYTPFGYSDLSALPVIYVADGHEYANSQMGSMVVVLDNMIYLNLITPVIAVFIDPRNPKNLSENRRANEYTGNIKYANFVSDELVPVIDANYKTNPSPDFRAILGTSYGGNNASYFGVKRSDVFHLIAPQSPAIFDDTFTSYENSPLLPLKTYLTTGVIYDTEDKADRMASILENKGYLYKITKVNEGHSWGNWRALLDDILLYFFKNENTHIIASNPRSELTVFPNPIRDDFSILIPLDGNYTLEWFDVTGKCVYKNPQTLSFVKNQHCFLSVPTSFKKGVYQLLLKNDHAQFTQRIILDRP